MPTIDPDDTPTPTLSEEIKEFEEVGSGVGGKEKLIIPENKSSKQGVEVIPTHPEIEKHPEFEGYIEKIEKEAELTSPIRDDKTNQIILSSSAAQNPKIKLPLTDDQIMAGLHHKVWESIRWLSEWCLRQMQLAHQSIIRFRQKK